MKIITHSSECMENCDETYCTNCPYRKKIDIVTEIDVSLYGKDM